VLMRVFLPWLFIFEKKFIKVLCFCFGLWGIWLLVLFLMGIGVFLS